MFVGGHPLTAEVACSAIRGLKPDRFQEVIDSLNRRYRKQGRPYSVQFRDEGFVLTILPSFRGLREKLFGGPREARLGQAAIDVLSVIAYRQPIGKAEIDSLRGIDSVGTLRQLVRLGVDCGSAPSRSREPRGTLRHYVALLADLRIEQPGRVAATR